MKNRALIILVFLALYGVCRAETNTAFGIYLADQLVDRRHTAMGQGDWSGIRLAKYPLISAEDIVSYDFTNHVIQLRPNVLAKIPRPTLEGTPFVLVAGGQRIYLGVFTTCTSSMQNAVPNIMVDRAMMVTNQAPDILVIDRGYPHPEFGLGPDPRGDERIKAALAALHKLKDR